MADTIISGSRRAYPPVISAMRNMAVIGACITPAISPAMPTRAKLASGTAWKPMRLTVRARMKPAMPPTIRVGPKVPPTPPPALVKDMANTLNTSTRAKYMGITHLCSNIPENREFSRIVSGLPCSMCPRDEYPSPYRGGKMNISRPSIPAQKAHRLKGLDIFLMRSSRERVVLRKYRDTRPQNTPSTT